MVQLVEAVDENAALKIANPPTGCIPTVYELKRPVTAEGEDSGAAQGGRNANRDLSDNLFVLIYP
ncbi:MAG: hypothetical protein GIW98_03590 [Candidatus Eremiobacteraeota bacterium]|nr:hypothetical protein [Candidatus Eremiobacteraeota bacterium]